jgi:hypothetical protein
MPTLESSFEDNGVTYIHQQAEHHGHEMLGFVHQGAPRSRHFKLSIKLINELIKSTTEKIK